MHLIRSFSLITVLLLLVIGILRIAATYRVFWQTFDEPHHIAAGMQWLDKKVYTYEHLHPPLARVMDALGLFFVGIRTTGHPSLVVEGNILLHSNNAYEHNLTMARLGVLPFFILSTLVVWAWANLYYGKYSALLSVAVYSTLPPILAHSGLATTDMAVTSLVLTALFAFLLWIEKPTLRRSILLGIVAGLAVLSKFSALIFLPLAAIFMTLTYLPRRTFFDNGHRPSMAAAGIVVVAGILIIWAGYWFSFSNPASNLGKTAAYNTINQILGSEGLLHNMAYFVVDRVPVPAPEFLSGLAAVAIKNLTGHLGFLLGEVRTTGWWYFFPVALAVKTPLPFLVLTVVGCAILLKNAIMQPKTTRLLAPPAAAAAILGVAMASNINIGLRHILPVYPLLAIVAGYGAFMLLQFRKGRGIWTGIAVVLLVWQIISSGLAHPDYLAYFNELAGSHPEEILVDSDLDWGQDLKRLAKTIEKREINELSIRVLTSAHRGIGLGEFGFPPTHPLSPDRKTSGWIAISATVLKTGTRLPPYDQYKWLETYEPVEEVGKSIKLYYIEE